MNRLDLEQLRHAWQFPLPNEDPDRDLDNRLESVRDAIAEAQGDFLGFWSMCRLTRNLNEVQLKLAMHEREARA